MNAWRNGSCTALVAALMAGSALAADDGRIVVGQTVALTGSMCGARSGRRRPGPVP